MLLVLGTACGSAEPRPAIDLIEKFPSAIEVRPDPAVFATADFLAGDQRSRALVVNGSSRVVFHLTVPERGELRAAIGLPDAAAGTRSAVLFRVMVATDGSPGPDVLLSRQLETSLAGDPGWQEIAVDLSPFATETVSIFLNTNSDPGVRAAWLAPRIVERPTSSFRRR
jgi:hypothetical protein